jgi:hypothetical protein
MYDYYIKQNKNISYLKQIIDLNMLNWREANS